MLYLCNGNKRQQQNTRDMKTILMFILGIILGIISIKLFLAAFMCLISMAILSAAINTVFAIVMVVLTKKCFTNM